MTVGLVATLHIVEHLVIQGTLPTVEEVVFPVILVIVGSVDIQDIAVLLVSLATLHTQDRVGLVVIVA